MSAAMAAAPSFMSKQRQSFYC